MKKGLKKSVYFKEVYTETETVDQAIKFLIDE